MAVNKSRKRQRAGNGYFRACACGSCPTDFENIQAARRNQPTHRAGDKIAAEFGPRSPESFSQGAGLLGRGPPKTETGGQSQLHLKYTSSASA
ncbi:MAG: hypothetical protein M5U25_07665 [Planctomycetota bacterium]|nr:hypothetical protein [Planctomycetota bacterium]